MTIRSFCPEDWAAYRSFSLDFYSGGATLHPIPEEHLRRTFAEALSGNPLLQGVMLEAGGEVVGFALLAFTWSNEAGGLTVILDEFYIAPAHRSAGYGSSFLEWLFETYRDAKRIRLEVAPENPSAHRLYERTGFEPLPYLQMIKDRE